MPVVDLEATADAFCDAQPVGAVAWAGLDGETRPRPGLFVARVVGPAVDRRVPSGRWCVWRARPADPLEGKVVLVERPDVADPELGEYVVRIFETERTASDDGGWRPVVRLEPDSTDPTFGPIVLDEEA